MAKADMGQAGARVRARRLDLGLRQADLAAAVGISPSYLNLIEHNRRRIGADLMARLAPALQTQEGLLSGGADRDLLDALRQAAADTDAVAEVGAEVGKVEDMAARYPGWAALIATQAERIAAQDVRAQVLSDRISYDPALATALHGVISAVTSIRSTAAILTSGEALDADWQDRFHRNIHDDAVRLADDSSALVGYLDAPGDAEGVPLTPTDEASAWLAAVGFHVAALERGATVSAVLDKAKDMGPQARVVLGRRLAQYRQDAEMLPLDRFSAAALQAGGDPYRLSQDFAVPLAMVLRRLASLPDGAGHPPMGLAVVDAGGFALMLKDVPGFALPRGTACPLWPVFTALGQAGRPISTQVTVPGRPDARLMCHAIAEQTIPAGGVMPPQLTATMLVIPDPPETSAPVLPLGVACRICPRATCVARREPSAFEGAGGDGL